MIFVRFHIALVILFPIIISVVSNENGTGKSLPGNDVSLPVVNRTSRTLYGLLGLLAGFPGGQHAANLVDYGQTFVEAKNNWFKAHVLNKYPLLFFPPPLPHPLPAPAPPTQYLPPLWYPPFIIIPPNNVPINQQQIINLHEPSLLDNSLNDNYQEFMEHNTQTINNNIRPSKEKQIVNTNAEFKNTKNKKHSNIRTQFKTEAAEEENENVEELTTIRNTMMVTTKIPKTTTSSANVTTSVSMTTKLHVNQTTSMSTTSSLAINTTTSSTDATTTAQKEPPANSSASVTLQFPYHYPTGNRSNVDDVTFTTFSEYDQGNVHNVPVSVYNDGINDVNIYQRNYDNMPPDIVYLKQADKFSPMGENVYDRPHYTENNEKYNFIQNEAEFLPLYK